jgi:sedoheptulose-bisphosphatase
VGSQENAILAIYGPRTTAILYNPEVGKVQELTLIDEVWMLSRENCVIKPKTNLFSPGNARSASENVPYREKINTWMQKGYTLRYTGGMVPDVAQIFIKGHGVFSCCASKSHKAKLRVLYEVACVGFLMDKANGKTITTGKIPITEYQVKTYSYRLPFAVGSSEEINALQHLF